jgi:hypothetical protein
MVLGDGTFDGNTFFGIVNKINHELLFVVKEKLSKASPLLVVNIVTTAYC